MDSELLNILTKNGIKPKDIAFYKTAFTHRSYLNESKSAMESNERMEFLGDSVLSFITSSYLFNKRLKDTEGDLTNLRAFIVKTDSLAKASSKLGLGELLNLSKGEEISGGRNNPQLLANTFEALLGAVYLDLGIEEATKFVESTLLPIFKEEMEKGAPKDSKSLLQEQIQARMQTSPKYKILGTTGPDHAKKFTVGVFINNTLSGQGTGSNKQQAEEAAAEQALISLEKH
ncbi:MAG: ribonuclease III [Candidatus Daviesbacteria bacterium]|nr:ribonuclease III [Candidatus Daviesbacteria bacterium]